MTDGMREIRLVVVVVFGSALLACGGITAEFDKRSDCNEFVSVINRNQTAITGISEGLKSDEAPAISKAMRSMAAQEEQAVSDLSAKTFKTPEVRQFSNDYAKVATAIATECRGMANDIDTLQDSMDAVKKAWFWQASKAASPGFEAAGRLKDQSELQDAFARESALVASINAFCAPK